MYKKLSTGWLKHLDFMILDMICLQLAFVMGYFLRHHSLNPYENAIYRNEAIVFALIQVVIMFFDDSFKNVHEARLSGRKRKRQLKTWYTSSFLVYSICSSSRKEISFPERRLF